MRENAGAIFFSSQFYVYVKVEFYTRFHASVLSSSMVFVWWEIMGK